MLTRREVIEAGLAVAAGWGLTGASTDKLVIMRRIPGAKEELPVVGLGTNAYSVTEQDELAARRAVLERMPQLGGKVVDTAPGYGRSEIVVGALVADLGIRSRLFLATKVTADGGDVQAGKAMLEESFRRLKTDRIDLMQVHNLAGAEALLPILREEKKAGRIRYTGITTSNDAQYEEMAALMRRHPIDFIQVDYSIANRSAAEVLLPLARDKGIGVLINMPFGGRRGGNLFRELEGRPLPAWASEIDASSWAELLLKYCISHPAVTCVIPGTTKVSHLEANQKAARGRLPDAALRRRMESDWDAA